MVASFGPGEIRWVAQVRQLFVEGGDSSCALFQQIADKGLPKIFQQLFFR